MSMWKRIVNVFRSRSNAKGAEDLEATLDESYRSQLKLLQGVRRGVADVTTSRKRIELQITKLRRQGQQLEKQARTSVQSGDDATAKRVLTRKIAIEESVADLDAQHEKIKADEIRLVDASREIESKIETFRTRRETLSARSTAAEARSTLNSTVRGISGEMGEVGHAMKETEQRTRELEAQANAVDELVSEGIMGDGTDSDGSDSFDRKFAALSRQSESKHSGSGQPGDSSGQSDVDKQLEALKQETSAPDGERHGHNQV